MTWAYRVNVLDLEPRGPLPPEIYWRRRGLALGIGVVVVGIVIAIVVAVLSSSAGANTTGGKSGAADLPPVVLAPALLLITATIIAITMPTATTAMPSAKPLRRQ